MPKVDYNGLIADVLEDHLESCVVHLSQCSRAERRQILGSVKKALKDACRAVDEGIPLSEKQMQNIADDIGIWFAGETLAGRAEQYKAMVQ